MSDRPVPPEGRTAGPEVPSDGQSLSEAADRARRAANVQRLLPVLALAGVLASTVYAVLYVQTRAWEALVSSAVTLMATLACLAALAWLRQGKLDRAIYLLLGAATILLVANELSLEGATLLIALGALVAGTVISVLVLPREQVAWAVAVGVLGAGLTLLIDRVVPWSRFRVAEDNPLGAFILLAVGAVGLLVFWFVVRAFHTNTFRNQLLFAFLLVGVLPVAIIGSFSIAAAWRSGQQQAIAQLELAAAFREAEVSAWIEGAKEDLAAVLFDGEVADRARAMLGAADGGLDGPDAAGAIRADLESDLGRHMAEASRFVELFVMDAEGRVILSSALTSQERRYDGGMLLRKGLDGPYLHPPAYDGSLGQVSVIAVHPILSQEGQLLGALGSRVNTSSLDAIMLDPTGLGETGETYLVGEDYVPQAGIRPSGERSAVRTLGSEAAVAKRAAGTSTYRNHRGEAVVGVYRWLPELGVAMLAEQRQAEAFRAVYALLAVHGSVILFSALIAVVASLSITRSIATPLSDLAQTASRIAQGERTLVASVGRDDEIGLLAQAFNSMTGQLRALIGNLEQRIAERTRDLERRSSYLEAAAEVGSAITSILDQEPLMGRVVELIRARFGLYYVGLFLTDEGGEWAVLRAGTGDPGQAMLARGHRIRVGEGMVGWSVAHAQPRVASDAARDAVRLAFADLPDTRSEAALPLRSRGQVIGALAVQSDRAGAFGQDMVTALQIMADQVAAALDNARLFSSSSETVDAVRRAYGDLSRQEWAEWLGARSGVNLRSDARGVAQAADAWSPELQRAVALGRTVQEGQDGERWHLAIPIKVRGSVIGALDTHKPDGQWTREEVSFLEQIVEQLELALDNARLYEDAQRLGIREQQLREIGARMQGTFDLDAMLRTVVADLAQALHVDSAYVQLTPGRSRLSGDGLLGSSEDELGA